MKALNAEGHEMEVEIEDLTLLSDVHEGAVMHVLRDRYMKDRIFTFIGSSVLVSVNPFKDIGDNTSAIRRSYINREQGELPPHIYAFADRSLRALVANNESQSIIVSGESGAGKTEACKLVMNFLSDSCSHGSASASGRLVETLMKKIISTNPVLEAFGNAKTLRNNNSSRFGKFLQIDFSAGGSPMGAAQRVYLLEKSRIVSQGPMERNFHIFYQLCAGASPEQKVDTLAVADILSVRILTFFRPNGIFATSRRTPLSTRANATTFQVWMTGKISKRLLKALSPLILLLKNGSNYLSWLSLSCTSATFFGPRAIAAP